MARRTASSAVGVLALAALCGAAPVLAQAPAPDANVPAPSKEQLEQAAFELRVMVSALQSDKVDAPIKDALFRCIYTNNFAKISDAMGKVIADNAGKVDKRNPDQLLFIMSRVCGFNPQQGAATPPAGAAPSAPAQPAAPAGSAPAPQGR